LVGAGGEDTLGETGGNGVVEGLPSTGGVLEGEEEDEIAGCAGDGVGAGLAGVVESALLGVISGVCVEGAAVGEEVVCDCIY
jgi:hypothetical protein